jgi:hypothetical protein
MEAFINRKVAVSQRDFDALAQHQLNDVRILVTGVRYRICEVEFYYNAADHQDLYSHSHSDQTLKGYFHFHKFSNGTYKGGTWKGLDIVMGSEKPLAYFGILIRSLEAIDTGEFIEGPCKCVNRMLEHHGATTVKEFMDAVGKYILPLTHDTLCIEAVGDLPQLPIYSGKRIGLSDKYPEFRDRAYRYVVNPHKIRKQRTTLRPLQDVEIVT